MAKKTSSKKVAKRPSAKPKLLSGGNPQIPMADGDAPVQAYIAAMPGWKREAGRQLDALIVRTVPKSLGVRKSVKWNSPFYGVKDPAMGWFLSFHALTKYIKVAFFRGASLHPLPPVASKMDDVRYLHIHEGDATDEDAIAHWIKQAAALPGWFAKEGEEVASSASQQIDARIEELGDWRGRTLARVRALIKHADPQVVEQWKWSVPVWSHPSGARTAIICTGETYKNSVKLTFPKGASLVDPSGLFNASLQGATRRAIDFHEGDKINEKSFKALIRRAVGAAEG